MKEIKYLSMAAALFLAAQAFAAGTDAASTEVAPTDTTPTAPALTDSAPAKAVSPVTPPADAAAPVAAPTEIEPAVVAPTVVAPVVTAPTIAAPTEPAPPPTPPPPPAATISTDTATVDAVSNKAPKSWGWVFSLGIGGALANTGQDETIDLTPTVTKTYSAEKKSSTMFGGELFGGVHTALSDSLQLQVGLAIAALSDAEQSGEIWDDADPAFNNHSYNYKIQHSHVAVKAKLLFNNDSLINPWISVSLGMGQNKAHGFTNSPLISQAESDPDFGANTTTSFMYAAGLGAQLKLADQWQLGLGYEFSDLGRSQLGAAEGQTNDSGPKLDHLYTHGVLINLTFVN